jgi:hypothetical protein
LSIVEEFYFKMVLISAALVFLLLLNDNARFNLRKAFRFVIYENLLVRILRNKFLQMVVPGLAGTYFLILDVWGDKWEIVTHYQKQHAIAFMIVIGVSLLILFVRGIADYVEERRKAKQLDIVERLVLLASRAVKMKLKRFKDEAISIQAGGNVFEKITQPKHQLNLLLDEIVDFLTSKFGLKEDQVSITIMHFNPQSKRWVFKYETQKDWTHTKPEVLLKEQSTAKECLDIGEAVFHPDKARAAKKGKYYLSARDKRTKSVGSVYCYPAFTQTTLGRDKYLISIVTYGQLLCDPLDTEQANAIRLVFTDICRRIDLELTLESIKFVQQRKPTVAPGAGP